MKAGIQPYGKHNASKYKVLFFLALVENRHARSHGCTARVLHYRLGISLGSLRVSLQKWTKWGYVSRRRGKDAGHEYRYFILAKGRRFLNWANVMLPVSRFVDEIEAHQRKNS